MGKVTLLEVQGYTEWSSAAYVDDSGEEYEIVFTRNFNHNTGLEEKEVVSIEKAGIDVDPEDPLWKEIEEALKGGEI